MTEQAESTVAVDEPKPELISSEPIVEKETEKADATPLLLELKAMVEKLTNTIEQMVKPEAEESAKVWDFPEEQMTELQAKYGEEKSNSLLELVGDEAFMLLMAMPKKADEPEVEEPKAEEPVKETEEEVAEMTEPKVEVEEAAVEPIDKSQIIEELQGAMEAKVEETLEKYAPVQKRSLVPKTVELSRTLNLFKLSQMDWNELDAFASRGA